MKIRQGFVSNSSSSSFTCSYCEENISGMDMYPELSCANDHDFCEYCADKIELPELNIAEMKEYIDKHNTWNAKWDPDRGIDYEEWVEDTYQDCRSDHGFDTSLCPCCTLKKIPNSDLLPYLLRKYNLTPNQVREMMRAEKK